MPLLLHNLFNSINGRSYFASLVYILETLAFHPADPSFGDKINYQVVNKVRFPVCLLLEQHYTGTGVVRAQL